MSKKIIKDNIRDLESSKQILDALRSENDLDSESKGFTYTRLKEKLVSTKAISERTLCRYLQYLQDFGIIKKVKVSGELQRRYQIAAEDLSKLYKKGIETSRISNIINTVSVNDIYMGKNLLCFGLIPEDIGSNTEERNAYRRIIRGIGESWSDHPQHEITRLWAKKILREFTRKLRKMQKKIEKSKRGYFLGYSSDYVEWWLQNLDLGEDYFRKELSEIFEMGDDNIKKDAAEYKKEIDKIRRNLREPMREVARIVWEKKLSVKKALRKMENDGKISKNGRKWKEIELQMSDLFRKSKLHNILTFDTPIIVLTIKS